MTDFWASIHVLQSSGIMETLCSEAERVRIHRDPISRIADLSTRCNDKPDNENGSLTYWVDEVDGDPFDPEWSEDQYWMQICLETGEIKAQIVHTTHLGRVQIVQVASILISPLCHEREWEIINNEILAVDSPAFQAVVSDTITTDWHIGLLPHEIAEQLNRYLHSHEEEQNDEDEIFIMIPCSATSNTIGLNDLFRKDNKVILTRAEPPGERQRFPRLVSRRKRQGRTMCLKYPPSQAERSNSTNGLGIHPSIPPEIHHFINDPLDLDELMTNGEKFFPDADLTSFPMLSSLHAG